jgi:four helix bundle protein
MAVIFTYKDLTVWQRSIELVVAIYTLTEMFPKEEIYGLSSQIRRSSVSIPSNIAEGRCRGSRKDYLQFLRIAYGSGAELETQLEIAKRLPKTKILNYSKVNSLLEEVMKMLNSMIRKLNPKL